MSATILQLRQPECAARPTVLQDIANHRKKIAAFRQLSRHARKDPIFEQIDRHCDALVVYHSATTDDASERAMNREAEVLNGLLLRPASSIPGILALLDHLGSPEFLIFDSNEGTGETILSEAVEISADKGKFLAISLKAMLSVAAGIPKLPG
jgi:hypothetical protein